VTGQRESKNVQGKIEEKKNNEWKENEY